jgi:hypothetical protein
MNENDLERRLRNERGPREEGYVAAQLPADLGRDGGQRGKSSLRRAALIAPAAVAGVLAVALVSAALSGWAPFAVGDLPSTMPSATASASGVADCAATDLDLSAEPWGAAAGSRGTVVTIALASGHEPCLIQRHVLAAIADADGNILVSADVAPVNDLVELKPDDRFMVGVSWSNWCSGAIAEPVALELALASGLPVVEVSVPAGADPVPPCLGENQPSALSVTELQSLE